MQLDRDARRRLQNKIDAAADDINAAHEAYQDGHMSHAQMMKLAKAHRAIADMLAFHDERTHGVVDDYSRHLMATYEHMASNLLDAVEAIIDEHDGRHTEAEKNHQGDRWIVSRTIRVRNKDYLQQEIVVNPAVGFKKLDAWEEKLRTTLQRRKSAA